LLSGGIGPDDAERVNAFYHPKCIGIDLNSRFELSPGLKDVAKLKEFMFNLNKIIEK
jgi:phosphoribosylanthranilate isomerase